MMLEDAEGRWALIVHGGAKEMEAGEGDDNRRGVLALATSDMDEPQAWLRKEGRR